MAKADGRGSNPEAVVIGRFIFGMVSGGVLVTGGLVVGAILFPLRGSEMSTAAKLEAAPAEEQVETVKADPVAEPEPAPEPEPVVEPEPTAAPEPEPEAVAEAPAEDVEPAAEAESTVGTVAAAPPAESTTAEVTPEATPESTAEVAVEPAAVAEPAEAPLAEATEIPAETAPAAEAAAVAETEPAPLAEPIVDPVAPAPAEPVAAEPVESAPAPEADPATAPEPEVEPAPEIEPAIDSAVKPEPVPEPEPEIAAEEPKSDASLMPGTRSKPLPGTEEPATPAVTAEAAPATAAAESSTLQPSPGLDVAPEGIVTGRLPKIGDAPEPEAEAEVAAEGAEAAPATVQPIVDYAAPFDNPGAKPVLSVVLIDTGSADLDRAALAALPFPVSFALDPMDPATPARAAIYRAAGREVVMLATGIAYGAQASDVEVAFQSMAQGLPEAVAVMDLATPTFQNQRPLASIVVPVVASQGRGILTWDQGLNAADQVARREDVPAAVIFRDIASSGTDGGAVRRLLDRAVFKAGQEGRAVVAGDATAETVAALLEWSVEGRAATIALGPLTAAMKVD